MMDALSPIQLRHFVEHGYVVVEPVERGCGDREPLRDDQLARVRDAFWAGAYVDCGCRRDDPASWAGPGRGGYRETLGLVPEKHPWLRTVLVEQPFVRAAAAQLLGGAGRPTERVAAPFCIRPFGAAGACQTIRIDQPHIDTEAFHLGIFLYANTVAPGGGGFTGEMRA
jgi:hypothetical protein